MPYRTWGRTRGNRLPAAVYRGGRPVHVVIGTAGRVPFFEVAALADIAFSELARHGLTLVAAVLPSHVHWLVSDGTDLSTTVGRYKSVVALHARERGFQQVFWQRSFWDHVIRSRQKLDIVVRYVAENPMHAGLCEDVDDWPYLVVYRERIEALR